MSAAAPGGADPAWIGDVVALIDRLPFERFPTAARLPLAAVGVAFAVWAVLRVVALVATRPAPVRPAPAGQDLPGSEPPAVVNLLVSGWSVTEDAAEATLLDLAARGYLELRQPDGDARHTTVHVVAQDPTAAADVAARQARVRRAAGRGGGGEPGLTVYERLVLERVQRVAVGGVVPLTALTFRDAGDAEQWAQRFAKAVVADARGRGLVRARVPAWLVSLLQLSAVVPALAVGWLAWELDGRSDPRALLAGLVPFAVLAGVGVRRGGLRGTPRGREAAAGWLGLRGYLVVDRAFAALPPSAVAVWDRYLAYGAALGVTHVASAAIDLGTANRGRVWSSYGGSWRQVRVRYPGKAGRYGAGAAGLILRGLVAVAAGAGPVWAYLTVLPQWRETLPAQLAGPLHRAGWIAALAGLLAVRGTYRVLRTLIDLLTPRTIRGEVLWVAPWKSATTNGTTVPSVHYLAVDDGSSDRTTAWAMPRGITRGFGPGDVVEITVRPWSRLVTALGVVQSRRGAGTDVGPSLGTGLGTGVGSVPGPAPGAGAGAGASVVLSPAEVAAGAPLTAAELGGRLGVAVGEPQPVPAGASGAWLFPLVDGGGDPDAAVLLSVGSGRPDHLVLGLHRTGDAVRGLGDEAFLTAHGAVARSGDVVVRVAVPVGHTVPTGRFVALLGLLLSRLPAARVR